MCTRKIITSSVITLLYPALTPMSQHIMMSVYQVKLQLRQIQNMRLSVWELGTADLRRKWNIWHLWLLWGNGLVFRLQIQHKCYISIWSSSIYYIFNIYYIIYITYQMWYVMQKTKQAKNKQTKKNQNQTNLLHSKLWIASTYNQKRAACD